MFGIVACTKVCDKIALDVVATADSWWHFWLREVSLAVVVLVFVLGRQASCLLKHAHRARTLHGRSGITCGWCCQRYYSKFLVSLSNSCGGCRKGLYSSITYSGIRCKHLAFRPNLKRTVGHLLRVVRAWLREWYCQRLKFQTFLFLPTSMFDSSFHRVSKVSQMSDFASKWNNSPHPRGLDYSLLQLPFWLWFYQLNSCACETKTIHAVAIKFIAICNFRDGFKVASNKTW